MRGEPGPRENVAFRQDKNFWWLTGVESPDVALLMDLDSGREVLFVARPSAFKERWEGEIWDTADSWIPELTGFEEVRPVGDLLEVLDEALGEEKRKLWTSRASSILLSGSYDAAGPHDSARKKDPLDGRPHRAERFAERLEERYGLEVEDAWPAISRLRAIKTPEELEDLAAAVDDSVGGRAGVVALNHAAPLALGARRLAQRDLQAVPRVAAAARGELVRRLARVDRAAQHAVDERLGPKGRAHA